MSNLLPELRSFCLAHGIPFNEKASTCQKLRDTQHHIANLRTINVADYEAEKKEFNELVAKYNRQANLTP